MPEALDPREKRSITAAVDDVRRLMGSDSATVWIRGRDGLFRVLATHGVGSAERRANPLDGDAIYTDAQFAGGRPVLVSKLTTPLLASLSPRHRWTLRRTQIRAYGTVPIGLDSGSRALLTLGFRKDHAFSQSETATLRLIGRQIGALLDSSARLRESRQRVLAMSAIAEVSALVAGTLALGRVLRRIAENACRVLDISQAFIFTLEPDGALVDAISRSFRVPAGQPAAIQIAMRKRRTEVITDARNDPRASARLVRRFGTRALICTPLIAHGIPLGVLCLIETRGPRLFNDNDIELLETMANYAAIAIAHAGAHADLVARGAELQALSARLASAHESERRRISRELHDVVGQGLAALALDLASMERAATPGAATSIRSARQLLRETTQAARRLTAELHPSVLDDLGLAPAVRWYCGEFARRSGLRIHVVDGGRRARATSAAHPIPAQAAFVLYRAAQEGLNNVLRHAHAARVTVRIRVSARTFRLEIDDDGIGPERAKARGEHPGIGLLSIRERAEPLGGKARLVARRPRGARLVVEIPRDDDPGRSTARLPALRGRSGPRASRKDTE